MEAVTDLDSERPLQLEEFKESPQRSGETWLAGLIRLPVWLRDNEGVIQRQWAGICGPADRIGHAPSRIGPLAARSVESALAAILIFADSGVSRRRPGRLLVASPELQLYLSNALDGAGIEIALDTGHSAELDVAARQLAEELHLYARIPGLLRDRDMTLERVRAFAEAAKEYYDARPWDRLDTEDLIHIEAPAPGLGLSYAVVCRLPNMDGIFFFDSQRDLQKYLDADAGARVPERGLWSLVFEYAQSVPLEDADLWEDQCLPLADAKAYPFLAKAMPNTLPQRPRPREVSYVEGLLKAIARSTEAEMDSGRWTKPVDTFDGPQEYVLSIPGLLSPISEDAAPPAYFDLGPDPRSLEYMGRRIKRGDPNYDPNEDLEEYLARKVSLDMVLPPSRNPAEEAEDLIIQAIVLKGRRRFQKLRRALEICPDCADAYVMLGERCSDHRGALDFFLQGLAAAKRSLPPELIEQNMGRLWRILEARPYLKALYWAAMRYEALGQLPEAIAHFEELLPLDAGDEQAGRVGLARCFFKTGDLDRFEAFWDRYKDEMSAPWLYPRALCAFRKQGDAPRARELLTAAHQANPHVRKYLLREQLHLGEVPDDYGPGSRREALRLFIDWYGCWSTTTGAEAWLEEHTPRNRPRTRKRRRRRR